MLRVKEFQKAAADQTPRGLSYDQYLCKYSMEITVDASKILSACKEHTFAEAGLDRGQMQDWMISVVWGVADLCNLYGFSLEEILMAGMKQREIRKESV